MLHLAPNSIVASRRYPVWFSSICADCGREVRPGLKPAHVALVCVVISAVVLAVLWAVWFFG